ncbi:wax ester/triacylglycerol synthase domain-containing protein [Spirillospora sp. NPDC050679]
MPDATDTNRAPAQPLPIGTVDRVMLDLAARSAAESNLHVGGLLLVPGPPPRVEHLASVIAERLAHAPVLRHRLSPDETRWEPDPEFDPAFHVVQQRTEAGSGAHSALLQASDPPFDRRRPLWRLVLMHGYDPPSAEPGYALAYIAHHAFQDGMAVVHTLEALFGDRSLAPPDPGETAAELRPWRWPAPRDLGLPLRPTASWTPARGDLTGRRELLPFQLDSQALRDGARAAKVTGATRNHMCLASLTHALRQWTPQDWTSAVSGNRQGLHVSVPLNLRPPDGGSCLGNRLGGLRVALPCHRPSPAQWLPQVVGQTSLKRVMRHRAMHQVLQSRIPYRVMRAMYLRYIDARYVGMLVSTVRMRPLSVAGTPVRAVIGLPPLLPGQPMIILLVQYRNTVHGTLLFDGAVEGTARLVELWRRAVDGLRRTAASAP